MCLYVCLITCASTLSVISVSAVSLVYFLQCLFRTLALHCYVIYSSQLSVAHGVIV